MARSKKRKPQPVPTTPILREIRKALAEIRLKRKKATLEQQEALDLELKVLNQSYEHIHDIWAC
jgi:hypothetical protein